MSVDDSFNPSDEPQEPFGLPLPEFLRIRSTLPLALLGAENAPIIAVGGYAILGGAPGSGKTTAAIDLAFHAATGLDWLGMPIPRPVRVLLIENEGTRGLFQDKLAAKAELWGGEPEGVFISTRGWGSFELDVVEAWDLRGFAEANQIDLVIGDPLISLGVEGEGSPQNAQSLRRLLVEGGLGKVAFLLLHHVSIADASRLSGVWGRPADSVLILRERSRDSVELVFQKLRWAGERQGGRLVLTRDWEAQSFRVATPEERLRDEHPGGGATGDDLYVLVRAYLERNPSASANQVQKQLGGNRSAIQEAVRRVRAGLDPPEDD